MLHTVPKNEFSSKDFFIKCQQILTSIGISSCLLMASFNKKLPEAVVWKCSEKRCSENMQQIYRRASMPKFDFKNVALQFYWNHTEKTPIFLIFIFWWSPREKYPNAKFFLVRIFLYSDWIKEMPVLSPNTGKYGQEKTPYLCPSHAVNVTHTLALFCCHFCLCCVSWPRYRKGFLHCQDL